MKAAAEALNSALILLNGDKKTRKVSRAGLVYCSQPLWISYSLLAVLYPHSLH